MEVNNLVLAGHLHFFGLDFVNILFDQVRHLVQSFAISY